MPARNDARGHGADDQKRRNAAGQNLAFFCAVIKSPARMAFYKAYHMKETIAGIALSACSGPQHMVL